VILLWQVLDIEEHIAVLVTRFHDADVTGVSDPDDTDFLQKKPAWKIQIFNLGILQNSDQENTYFLVHFPRGTRGVSPATRSLMRPTRRHIHDIPYVKHVHSTLSKTMHCLTFGTVSYTHLRAHETVLDLVCRLLLEKKK